jgi:hypothetical protein
MNRSLSNTDIERLLHGKTRVILYQDLQRFSSIEQALQPYGNVVILYPARSNVDGHWVCVLYSVDKRGRRVIEFFDPYGYSPDTEFSKTSIKLPRFLARLLIRTRYPLEYNNHKIQKQAGNINTCGRHVVNRIWNKDLDIDTYNKLFGSSDGVNADALVTYVTSNGITPCI